jgi:non-specific serine/threonine protein kinase
MSRYLVTSILFDGSLALEWEEGTLADSPDRQRLEPLLFDASKSAGAGNPGMWLIVLGLSEPAIPLSPCLAFWRELAARWVHLARTAPDVEERRGAVSVELPDAEAVDLLQRMPAMTGVERADLPFVQGVWRSMCSAFSESIRDFKGPVEDYFHKTAPRPRHVDRIHFHLVENRKDGERPFAFLATYTTRIDEHGKTRHLPLRHAMEEYRHRKDKLLELLAAVNKVARKNALIASLVESGELFHPVAFKPADAFAFLNGVQDFEAAGILCRIPRWWRGARKASVTLSVGNAAPSRLGFDALLDFETGLCLDGEEISESEARRILENAEGLALIKGRWVAVDTDSLKKTLDALKEAGRLAGSEHLSFGDAMRMLMGTKDGQAAGLAGANVEVTCGDWLKSVLEKMTNPTLIRQTEHSPALKASLRPYQKQGLNWLSFMHNLGFGVCLADDMGLGKTVQMLAHLQRLKGKGRTSLIVCPASLMENWRREIDKFTPDLDAVILHPQAGGDVSMDDLRSSIASRDIAITTYGMLNRCSWISSHKWFYVVCDEAQAIKNPGTKQAKAVKTLQCSRRGVMTGTPVENRLSDLWSLFDFINPGLLGSFNEFRGYVKALDNHPEGYGRLRRVVHPYILRRSKTDKTIINDLPDKVEMKTFCPLTKAQAVLYQDVVRRLEQDLKDVDGIQRKGVVLACLMKCKQICNHPDHYSGAGAFLQDDSGKFQRLEELCDTIHGKREKVLVFTQFKEIIEPLAALLERAFGAPGAMLHGGTSVKQRKEAVDRFQGRDYVPFFVLSLKAGGVGLNLTEANHVIHFDRWWNPAVENQATDRAFRIGQKKNVVVHKFICKGTVEEKIDALIEDKKQLAGAIIPETAENWITEMTNDQVRDLFRLTLAGAGAP